MMSEQWNIIAKYLACEELSEEEKVILEKIKSDDEQRKYLQQSAEVFEKTDLFYNLKKFDPDHAWGKIDSHLSQDKKRIITLPRLLRIAAVVLIVIATGLLVWQAATPKLKTEEFATSQNDITNPEIILPDGTKVKLNHGSKLTYPEQFTGTTREVSLSGEAFFNVTHNAEKPFIIKINGASVKVLGTSFNVFAYNNKPIVEVIVKTGRVELNDDVKSGTLNANKVVLLPGEKGTLDKQKGILSKESSFDTNNLAWMTHEIKFKYTSLNEVFSTMEHTFNIRIVADENVDRNLQLNATFNHQDPDYIMNVVAMTLNLHLKKEGNNKYIIQNKK